MIRLSFLIACLFLEGSVQMPSETDWRGLSPLKSTRMDVERTLGPPDQKTESQQALTYRFRDMVVYFYFTSNPNCQQQLPYSSWNVAADILTGIDVNFRPPPLVADTGIDLTKYKKVKMDSDVIGRHVYLNDDSSFAIEVGNGYLAGYHYQPGSKEKDLRCEPQSKR
jgi:hypothetical protein